MSTENHKQWIVATKFSRGSANEESLLEVYLSLIEDATGLQASFRDVSGITHMVPSLRLSQIHRSRDSFSCDVCEDFWSVMMDGKLLGIIYLGPAHKPTDSERRGSMEKARLYFQACAAMILVALKASGITAGMLPSGDGRPLRILREEPHWLLASALKYIHSNYDRDISLSLVARHLHVRPQYLSRVFSQEQGLPLTHFLHRYRVEQAKQLFLTGQTHVTAVGMKVGFNDPSYFSRVFSKVVGLSPRQFINRQQNKSRTGKAGGGACSLALGGPGAKESGNATTRVNERRSFRARRFRISQQVQCA